MTTSLRTKNTVALAAVPTALLALLLVTLNDHELAQRLFVHASYYFLLVTLLCWVGTYLTSARNVRWVNVTSWTKENWPGLLIAASVTLVAAFAVDPALRVLSDEANLVGTSKNLFTSKTPTFTVSGKYYYGTYFDIDVAIDQRPALFPFLVSLVHALVGYQYANAFHLNLLLLPAFLLVVYRLGKSLGGELLGVLGSLLVVAHPILLVSVRSGGFDFLALFFGLLVVKSALDFLRTESADKLAVLWMNLCMFAGVRYESALFFLPVIALLLAFRMVTWSKLRPYALVYALTPVFLLPRIWQSLLRGNVPKQEAGVVTFSFDNFVNNTREYFLPLLNPKGSYPAHSAIVIALGLVGCFFGLRWMVRQFRRDGLEDPDLRFAGFVVAWMTVQVVIVFTYVWGRAQYPSAARLVLPIDAFLSLAAAAALARAFRRTPPLTPVLLTLGYVVSQVPVASEARMMQRLTETRENASTWRFFEGLPSKSILVVAERPGHFTIMGYGAMSFDAAKNDPYLFTALDRRLFQDIYLVQHVELSTGEPLSGFDFWSDRSLESVFEFQNDADVLVRISRVAH